MKAKVIRVIDGDTLEVKITVRLNRIDTPETRGIEKPLGLKTKAFVEQLLNGKEVDISLHGTDYYERALCDVFINDENVADILLREGLAEVYSPAKHNDGKIE